MSLPPDDDDQQGNHPQIEEPPVDPHDTRPLKPLLKRATPSKSMDSGQPASTVLREGGSSQRSEARLLNLQGEDDSTEQVRLVPKQPNPPTWRAIFLVGHPHANTVGVHVRQNLVIGRGEGDRPIGLDLSAHHATQQGVSREHAALIPTPEGLLISDLGSTNGTWINGEFLEPGYRHILAPGDQIELGLLRLVVRSVTLVNRSAG